MSPRPEALLHPYPTGSAGCHPWSKAAAAWSWSFIFV